MNFSFNAKWLPVTFLLLFFGIQCSSSQEPAPIVKKIERKTQANLNEEDQFSSIHPDAQVEQISCHPSDCEKVNFYNYSELDEEISTQMKKGAGKIFIQMRDYTLHLSDEPLEGVVKYLREITNSEGKVSMEPYYIGERAIGNLGFSFIKDAGMVSWNIFRRAHDSYYYRNTKNYNAKVLIHPKYHTIMMIFFVHKNYGDVCQTLYSNCFKIQYIDDDAFDLSLSTALKEAREQNRSVKIEFKQESAKLFDMKLNMENFKNLNKSARLYKWLILAKKTEQKPKKKERVLGVSLALSVLDYSLTLYDLYKAYKIYSPVLEWKAEVLYSGEKRGGNIESVVFYPTESEQ
jgi:hypothetical protein